MMENKLSTSGMLEDAIRSFVQLAAAELHAKTEFEISFQKVQEVAVPELTGAMQAMERSQTRLEKITELRRESMRFITKHAKSFDSKAWCLAKHTAMAMVTAFEAFQANMTDPDALTLYVHTNDLFISVMSDLIGLEIEPCAACFSDALKNATANAYNEEEDSDDDSVFQA